MQKPWDLSQPEASARDFWKHCRNTKTQSLTHVSGWDSRKRATSKLTLRVAMNGSNPDSLLSQRTINLSAETAKSINENGHRYDTGAARGRINSEDRKEGRERREGDRIQRQRSRLNAACFNSAVRERTTFLVWSQPSRSTVGRGCFLRYCVRSIFEWLASRKISQRLVLRQRFRVPILCGRRQE